MIGKASVFSALGDASAVREMLRRIDAALQRKPNLSAELKRELELARTSANATVDSR
jgi:hypothetical protein